jgi:hypothetical protein
LISNANFGRLAIPSVPATIGIDRLIFGGYHGNAASVWSSKNTVSLSNDTEGSDNRRDTNRVSNTSERSASGRCVRSEISASRVRRDREAAIGPDRPALEGDFRIG